MVDVDSDTELATRFGDSVPVLLRDAQYPGWSVRVDGEPARSLTANHAFRAVVVDAGEHEIEWRYRPVSVLAGAAASGLGVAAWLGLAVVLRRRDPFGGEMGGGPGRAS